MSSLKNISHRKRLSRLPRSCGELKVTRNGALLEMEFPAYELKPLPVTDQIADALGARPEEVYIGRDLLCIFKHEETVRNLSPDQQKLLALDGLGVQVTAPKEFDCVSRSFFPKLNVAEDPVCGSGHCHLFHTGAGRFTNSNSLPSRHLSAAAPCTAVWRAKKSFFPGRRFSFLKAPYIFK